MILLISIHVPLAGNVILSGVLTYRFPQISIHVPLAGTVCDASVAVSVSPISIHVPLAGNVCSVQHGGSDKSHFYPRSPCGERQDSLNCNIAICDISIHVPLAGNVVHT